MNKKISSSVIVATRNRADDLEECLCALSRQAILPTEVILVDNGSTDLTKKIIYSFRKKINIVYAYENEPNMARARNIGLNIAKGDLILITDDDCVASPDWIKDVICSHTIHPNVTAIQGFVKSIPENSIYSLIMQKQRDVRIKTSKLPDGNLLFLGTNNVSFKKSKLLDLKIKFDEGNSGSGADMDLAAQIVSKKGIILFDENIIIYGKERKGLISFLMQRFKRGATPANLKKKWPNFRFRFYSSSFFYHLTITYPQLCLYLLAKRRYGDFVRLPFILFLAILSFELGRLYQILRKDFD